MIQKLVIKNFKSVKEVGITCKKVNVFIGEPNSGKSNIIEALCLKSQNAVEQSLNPAMFRYNSMGDLFYDFNINKPIEVISDTSHTKLSFPVNRDGSLPNEFHLFADQTVSQNGAIRIDHSGKIISHGELKNTDVRYYEFKRLKSFKNAYWPHLSVPFGDNLPNLLLSNPEYKNWVSDFVKAKEFLLTLKPTENEMSLSKLVDGNIYSYPYFAISETLQRIIFYVMAMKTNKESTLLFDEPETNTFPFYTKFLAETIALDETNQFFLTTHNPYLLVNLIEKTPQKNINVCLVKMKNFETEVTVLDTDQVSKVLDFNSDVFFNFDKIVGE